MYIERYAVDAALSTFARNFMQRISILTRQWHAWRITAQDVDAASWRGGRTILRIARRVEITACLDEYLWHRSTATWDASRMQPRFGAYARNSAPRILSRSLLLRASELFAFTAYSRCICVVLKLMKLVTLC